MNSDRKKLMATASLMVFLSACATNPILEQPGDTQFGDANRQTMMAQVINPDPVYDTAVPVTSGELAVQAIERYRTDSVKQPEGIRTSNIGESSGSSQ